MTGVASSAPAHANDREPAAMSVHGAAVWAMAGQYLSFALQFASSVIISRLFLSPAEVGLFSIALAAALLVAVLQDFGLSRYISGLPSLGPEDIARCSTVALLFSFVVAGAIAASAVPMAWAYGHPSLAPILLIIAATYLVIPFAVVPMARMGRAMKFRGHFAVNVGGAITQAVVAITLAALGYSSFALAWATLATGCARSLIAQIMCPSPPWPLRIDKLRPVIHFGARSSIIYLTGALGTRSPDLIIGKLLNLMSVGFFSRAVALSDQFRMLVAGAIGSVFYPAFARIRDRGEPLGPAYLRVCAGYSAIIWPGMAGLALSAEPIVRLLYGEAWLPAAPLLSMIALTEVMLISLPLVNDLPMLLGRLNQLLVLNLIDTALSVVLLAIGCLWGVEGAAASRLVYGIAWLCLYWRFMHRLVQFDARALMAVYARSAGAALAAIAPLTLTYLFWAPPATIAIPAVFGAIAAGGFAWLAAMFLLRHPTLAEFGELAASLPIARRLLPKLKTASWR